MLGEIIPVRAEVKTIDGFSAHADQGEILRWLGSFKRRLYWMQAARLRNWRTLLINRNT